MNFFIFLIIFGAIFAFVSRDGFRAKFMAVAFCVSFVAMAAVKLGGAVFLDMLGTGVNTFLMVYDILALLTYKVPQPKAKDTEDDLLDGNSEIIEDEMQTEGRIDEDLEYEDSEGDVMPYGAEDIEEEDDR